MPVREFARSAQSVVTTIRRVLGGIRGLARRVGELGVPVAGAGGRVPALFGP